MMEAAFLHSAEAEGRRLQNIEFLAKSRSQTRILIYLKIRLNSILFADLILILIKPCQNLNYSFNPQEPKKFNPTSN